MKLNWVYIFKLKSGAIHEGRLCARIKGELVWETLPFCNTLPCIRSCGEQDIEWMEPVVEWKFDTTETGYIVALARISAAQDAPPVKELLPTPRYKRAIANSEDLARKAGQNFVGINELLLGVLNVPDGEHVTLLQRIELSREAMVEAAMRIAKGGGQ